MKPSYAALLAASLFAAAGLAAVGLRLRHGEDELARLAKEARADLRDALKAQKEVVHHYVYDRWPYWWGHAHHGWWEDRHTIIYSPQPSPQPAPPPEPRRRVETGDASATVNIESPRFQAAPRLPPHARPPAPREAEDPEEPGPLRRARGLVPRP